MYAMSSARPIFYLESGRKGMSLRWKIVLCFVFAAFKHLQVSVQDGAEAEVPLEI